MSDDELLINIFAYLLTYIREEICDLSKSHNVAVQWTHEVKLQVRQKLCRWREEW